MQKTTRILALVGAVALGAILSGQIAQRGRPASVTQFEALARHSFWKTAWSRADSPVTLLTVPDGQRCYVTSIHLGRCASACVTATLLIDDRPVGVYAVGDPGSFAPLRLQAGESLKIVTTEDGVGLGVTGYAFQDSE